MKNYISNGTTFKFTTDKELKSGQAIMMGDVCLISTDLFLVGEDAVCRTEGVYLLPKGKEPTDTFYFGETVGLNENGVVVKMGPKVKKAGVCYAYARSEDSEIYVKIN